LPEFMQIPDVSSAIRYSELETEVYLDFLLQKNSYWNW